MRVPEDLRQRLLERALESANGPRTTVSLPAPAPPRRLRILAPVLAAALLLLALFPFWRGMLPPSTKEEGARIESALREIREILK